MKVIFSKSATREWKRLPKNIQRRLKEKITFFLSQPNPIKFAKPIRDKELGDYAFRIGDYRALFDVKDKIIFVLKVGHRKDVYR